MNENKYSRKVMMLSSKKQQQKPHKTSGMSKVTRCASDIEGTYLRCWLSCSSMSDCSPPGSSVHSSQARILERVAISLSKGSSWPRDWTCIPCGAGSLLQCRWIHDQLSHEGSLKEQNWQARPTKQVGRRELQQKRPRAAVAFKIQEEHSNTLTVSPTF